MGSHRKAPTWSNRVLNVGVLVVGGLLLVGLLPLLHSSDAEAHESVVSPEGVAFLADLRRAGVQIEGHEDAAVDIAWQACHSGAKEVELEGAVSALFPTFSTEAVHTFLNRATAHCPKAS